MPEASATLIGVGTVDPHAHLTYVSAGAALVGEGAVGDAGARLTTPKFVVPVGMTKTPADYDLDDLHALEGDWTEIEGVDALSQRQKGARLVDGTWVLSDEYQQGAAVQGAEATEWHWEDGGAVYPARYWNGIDDSPTNQRFSVDTSGNVYATELTVGQIFADSLQVSDPPFSLDSAGGGLLLIDQIDLNEATVGEYVDFFYSGPPANPAPSRVRVYSEDGGVANHPWFRWRDETGRVYDLGVPLAGAKGDLIAASAVDTWAILGVGANDTILMADSAQAAGLKWVAAGTPSTQAFGDSAVVGTSDTFTRGDHKHAMMAVPTHAATTGQTANDHHAQVHGAADHTDVSRTIWIPATQLILDSTAALSTAGSAPNGVRVAILNDAVDEGGGFAVTVPSDWTSGSVTLTPYWGSAAGATGAVRWQVSSKVVADGGTYTAAASTDAWTGVSATRGANVLTIDTAQALTPTPVAGHLYRMWIRRLGTDGADTYTADAHLIGVLLTYTASQ